MAAHHQLLTPAQAAAIKEAVIAAELKSSGQIRVFVEEHCGEDLMHRAAEVFAERELHKTTHRNAVLIYLAIKDRKFAILGDAGIHGKVGEDLWHGIKHKMQEHFRAGQFTEGLIEGIAMAGDKLVEHFPKNRNDKNELPDDVIFG